MTDENRESTSYTATVEALSRLIGDYVGQNSFLQFEKTEYSQLNYFLAAEILDLRRGSGGKADERHTQLLDYQEALVLIATGPASPGEMVQTARRVLKFQPDDGGRVMALPTSLEKKFKDLVDTAWISPQEAKKFFADFEELRRNNKTLQQQLAEKYWFECQLCHTKFACSTEVYTLKVYCPVCREEWVDE